jgi:hypothetical protein
MAIEKENVKLQISLPGAVAGPGRLEKEGGRLIG